MKKLILFALPLLIAGFAQARPQNVVDDAIKIHYRTQVTASTHAILVDLSDTSTYPHGHLGTKNAIVLKSSILADLPASSSGTAKLGVVTFVNDSTGTVQYFDECFWYDTDARTIQCETNSAPPFTNLLTKPVINSAGTMQNVVSNDTLDGSADFQADVALPTSAGGHTAPGLGDIILTITDDSATAVNLLVELWYVTNR